MTTHVCMLDDRGHCPSCEVEKRLHDERMFAVDLLNLSRVQMVEDLRRTWDDERCEA